LNDKDAIGNEKIDGINDSLFGGSKDKSQLDDLNKREFSLGDEDENSSYSFKSNMMICKDSLSSISFSSSSQDAHQDIAIIPGVSTFTSTLDPCRCLEILTHEIHELMSSQVKLIAGLDHRKLIENTLSAIVADTGLVSFAQIGMDRNKHLTRCNIGEQLWDDMDGRIKALKLSGCEDPVKIESIDSSKDTGRSRSSSRSGRPPTRNNSRGPTPTPLVRGNGGGAPVSSRSRPSPSVDSLDSDPDLSSEKNQKVTDKTVLQRRRSTPLTKKTVAKTSSEKTSSSSALKDPSLSSHTDDREEDQSGKRESLRIHSQQQSDSISMDVLSALPIEIVRLVAENGVMRGMWLTSHPLEVQPLSFIEAFRAVDEVGNQSQLNWQLDLLREYDNQRMERYGSFLATKRSPSMEDQLKEMTIVVGSSNPNQQVQHKSTARKKGAEKGQVFIDYYKDKGRQSNR
jgi:hypothetical protein